MKKNKSSGGEIVQRIYSAIGGVPGLKEDPRTTGWQVVKWLSSALLFLLLLFMEHKHADYFTLLFIRFCIFFSFFRLGFFFLLIFGLSLLHALSGDGVWDHACRWPTHLLSPLVDDHLIYCNIIHTRTINERQRPKWRTKGKKKNVEQPDVFSSRAGTASASSSRLRRSETIGPRINWMWLVGTNVRISFVKRNGHEIAVVSNQRRLTDVYITIPFCKGILRSDAFLAL